MPPVPQHTRLLPVLLVVIFFARIDGSSVPGISPSQEQTKQTLNELEAEVAHWSAQLKSGDQEERREAVLRLSHLNTAASTSALMSASSDPSILVRAEAIAALGDRSEASAAAAIAVRLSSDKDPFVRKTAAYALGKAVGTERTMALIGALKDKDPGVRGAAAVSLGEHAEAAAVGPLASALADKDAFVRGRAARSLGVNGRAASQAVAMLIRLLASDPDGEVKRQAATALGSIGDSSALTVLKRAERDPDPYLVEAARESIRMIEGREK